MSASLPVTVNKPATLLRQPADAPRLDALMEAWPSTEPWIGYGKLVMVGLAVVTLLFTQLNIVGV